MYNELVRSKFVVIVTLVIVFIGGYLFFRYIQFYNMIGQKNLQSPYNQNKFVLKNPQKEDVVKYVALGDSLTAGVGSDDVGSTLVYQVAKKFSGQFGKVEVVNLGVSGATSQDLIVGQLPQVVQDLNYTTNDGRSTNEPQYITLLIGVNDIHNRVSVGDYKSRLGYIVDELLAKTNAQIILINLPYLGALDVLPVPLSNALDARTRQFNSVVAGFAGRERVKLVDLYGGSRQPFLDNPAYYASDGFHPSGEGYLLFGKIINAD